MRRRLRIPWWVPSLRIIALGIGALVLIAILIIAPALYMISIGVHPAIAWIATIGQAVLPLVQWVVSGYRRATSSRITSGPARPELGDIDIMAPAIEDHATSALTRGAR